MHPPFVIVGVVPSQPDAVIEQAAIFARHFGADLICAYVEASRYPVGEDSLGTVTSFPFDPDFPDMRDEIFDEVLRSHLERVLGNSDLRWSTRALAGDPAVAIGNLAQSVDAAMIVVGTRDAGVRGVVHELFNGSVAARLAHHQHRPVVVIPLDPVDLDGPDNPE
jgi:nucleotide-binding universal stress UspA family protein